jgi:metallophosphoesterase, MG_246/BB_0505 family
MNILFVGDVVGKVGRKALEKSLSFVKDTYNIDFTIVNGENITNGRGINQNHYHFLCSLPIDCITLGNHYKDKEEVIYILDNDNIIRPLNLLNDFPGAGSRVYKAKNKTIRVTNLLGTAFMKEEVKDPYIEMMKVLGNDKSDINIIDFHAEATGEKKAFTYSLEGKVCAVFGTHTHVQTADNQILNTGTAYISDVGMCGSYNSVLGDEIKSVVGRIILHDPHSRFKLLEDDDLLFNAVILNVDDKTNKAISLKRINLLNGKENG